MQSFVIPASEASPESFLKNDSGQAGMTENNNYSSLYTDTENDSFYMDIRIRFFSDRAHVPTILYDNFVGHTKL